MVSKFILPSFREFPSDLTFYFRKELRASWIEYIVRHRDRILGMPRVEEPENISALEKAREAGLLTPKSLISGNKSALKACVPGD